MSSYFDNTGKKDAWSRGVRMIPITTPKGTFKVWTKRVGNNPSVKLLLLHGGPAATHEYFEAYKKVTKPFHRLHCKLCPAFACYGDRVPHRVTEFQRTGAHCG